MGVVLRAHPVRGESHIQCNANREVATTSPPFYNEPPRSHVLFVKAGPGTTFLVTAPFLLRSEAQAASAQSFTLRQQATIEITCHDHPIIACPRHVYTGVVLRTHPVRSESHIQRNAHGVVTTLPRIFIKKCFVHRYNNCFSNDVKSRCCIAITQNKQTVIGKS